MFISALPSQETLPAIQGLEIVFLESPQEEVTETKRESRKTSQESATRKSEKTSLTAKRRGQRRGSPPPKKEEPRDKT